MSFWTDSTNVEPLRQYRWYIRFGAPTNIPSGYDENILEQFVFTLKECDKPEYKVETTSHVLLNHTFNYPKNLVWNPINIKMVSAIDNGKSTTSALHNIMSAAGYRNPSTSQTNQISKKLATFPIDIIQIDEHGNKIETWTLNNPFITNIKYGSLNYQSEDLVDISFTVTYDYASLSILTKEDEAKIKELLNSPKHETPAPRAEVFGGEVQGSGPARSGVLINGISD
jgi:hypothetical protein